MQFILPKLGTESLGPLGRRKDAFLGGGKCQRNDLRLPRLRKGRVIVLGSERAEYILTSAVQNNSPKDRDRRNRGGPALQAKVQRGQTQPYKVVPREA